MTGPSRLAAALFWVSTALIGAAYAVLPIAILIRGRVRPRPIAGADVEPTVSLVVAAHDEAASIGPKIESVLASDYPADRIECIVASDGSTDATVSIAEGFADPRIRVLDLPRVGKADVLNAAVATATGEILVFTDANSLLARNAVRALVRPFADAEVGGVAGDQRYLRGGSGAMATGELGYWDLDRMLKRAESAAGSVVSATGALYAVRRSLFVPIIAGVTDDFYESTGVIDAGRRLVFAEDAAAYEPVAASGGVEFGRKVRVMTRGLRGVVTRRRLLDPRTHGFYAIQLAWHKLLRRLVALPLIGLAVSAPALWRRGAFYRLATVSQATFYGLAIVGFVNRDRPAGRSKLVALPAYFCLVNAAALVAAWNAVRGRTIDRWEPKRGADATSRLPSTSETEMDTVGPGSSAMASTDRDPLAHTWVGMDRRSVVSANIASAPTAAPVDAA